jgi:hypothetical protein
MYSSLSPRVALLWNNDTLRKAMEEKHYTQLDALQQIHVCLEQIFSSASSETTTTTTTTTTTHNNEELPMRIMRQRISVLMRTIVKGTVEEIRQEQIQKNHLLLEILKAEFKPLLSQKRNFVLHKVGIFSSSLKLEERQVNIILVTWVQEINRQMQPKW